MRKKAVCENHISVSSSWNSRWLCCGALMSHEPGAKFSTPASHRHSAPRQHAEHCTTIRQLGPRHCRPTSPRRNGAGSTRRANAPKAHHSEGAQAPMVACHTSDAYRRCDRRRNGDWRVDGNTSQRRETLPAKDLTGRGEPSGTRKER